MDAASALRMLSGDGVSIPPVVTPVTACGKDDVPDEPLAAGWEDAVELLDPGSRLSLLIVLP